MCTFVHLNRQLAEERIIQNLDNWVTETDIQQIASLGFNSIRLPIGYWNIIEDPHKMFVPTNVNTSLQYIDWCFNVAAKYNVSLLVDLHGAPGSQNGDDHSGCISKSEWLKSKNIKLTLDAVEAIAERYSGYPNFLGVELLNEPGYHIEEKNHTELLRFYEDAYRRIRAHSETALVVFNELWSSFYDAWDHSLKEPEHFNVVIDLHLYDWQGNFTYETSEAHILDAEKWESVISDVGRYHPVVVGEWSCSTGYFSSCIHLMSSLYLFFKANSK